ncbi:hypothetical protein ACEQPO_02100 [Bacillus sp. SL00103]
MVSHIERRRCCSVCELALTKGSQHEEAAYKLLNYLSGKEAQEAFSEKSYYGMSNSDVKYGDKIREGQGWRELQQADLGRLRNSDFRAGQLDKSMERSIRRRKIGDRMREFI